MNVVSGHWMSVMSREPQQHAHSMTFRGRKIVGHVNSDFLPLFVEAAYFSMINDFEPWSGGC